MRDSFTVYVAASYKHLHAVRLLHEALRAKIPGIRILDWTAHASPPVEMTPAQRREWFDTEQDGGQVYSFCRDACQNADLVIYYGASGQDAGVEIGMASAAGVPILGLRGPLEAPGLMLHGAVDMWATSVCGVMRHVEKVATCDNDDPDNCQHQVWECLPACPRGRALAQEVPHEC